jgi:hypothetical protein
MRHYLVSITNPAKEKLVTDILHEIEGVEVERVAKPAKRPRPTLSAANGRAKSKTKKLALTPNEEKFMKGLTRAFKEMDEHIAGKRKLKTLKEVLDEL